MKLLVVAATVAVAGLVLAGCGESENKASTVGATASAAVSDLRNPAASSPAASGAAGFEQKNAELAKKCTTFTQAFESLGLSCKQAQVSDDGVLHMDLAATGQAAAAQGDEMKARLAHLAGVEYALLKSDGIKELQVTVNGKVMEDLK